MCLQERLMIGCKINLTLRITGVRADGWHELESLFLPLPEPHDELLISTAEAAEGQDSTAEAKGFTLHCTTAGIDPQNNTLTKAYTLFAEASGMRLSCVAELNKGIPHGAGLGGGSADAAALLLWLNRKADSPLSLERLHAIAASVGADVPFFLHNTPCFVSGIGERLTPCEDADFLKQLQGNTLVVVCPPEQVSTPWAYAAWDASEKKSTKHLTPEPESSSKHLAEGFATQTSHHEGKDFWEVPIFWLENSFEKPVFTTYPRLRSLKEVLLRSGARAAVMSGSGAVLVGLFASYEAAESCVAELHKQDVTSFCHAL